MAGEHPRPIPVDWYPEFTNEVIDGVPWRMWRHIEPTEPEPTEYRLGYPLLIDSRGNPDPSGRELNNNERAVMDKVLREGAWATLEIRRYNEIALAASFRQTSQVIGEDAEKHFSYPLSQH